MTDKRTSRSIEAWVREVERVLANPPRRSGNSLKQRRKKPTVQGTFLDADTCRELYRKVQAGELTRTEAAEKYGVSTATVTRIMARVECG